MFKILTQVQHDWTNSTSVRCTSNWNVSEIQKQQWFLLLVRAVRKQLWHSEMLPLCTEKSKAFSGSDFTCHKTVCQINNAFYWKGMGGLLSHDSSLSGAVIKSVACLRVSVTLFILIFQLWSSVQWMLKEELARESDLLVSVVFWQVFIALH